MKKNLILAAFCILSTAYLAAAEIVRVKVRGLDCHFCAEKLRVTFVKQDAVEKVEFDVRNQIMNLTMRENQTLDDKRIKKLVSLPGYEAKKITRTKK